MSGNPKDVPDRSSSQAQAMCPDPLADLRADTPSASVPTRTADGWDPRRAKSRACKALGLAAIRQRRSSEPCRKNIYIYIYIYVYIDLYLYIYLFIYSFIFLYFLNRHRNSSSILDLAPLPHTLLVALLQCTPHRNSAAKSFFDASSYKPLCPSPRWPYDLSY